MAVSTNLPPSSANRVSRNSAWNQHHYRQGRGREQECRTRVAEYQAHDLLNLHPLKSPYGTVKFEEQDGIDYLVVIVLLPGGERSSSLSNSWWIRGGLIREPWWGVSCDIVLGIVFLEPKRQSGSTGYDNAVVLLAGGRGDDEEPMKENIKKASLSTGKITLIWVIAVLETIQPCDADLGAKDPIDVKLLGDLVRST